MRRRILLLFVGAVALALLLSGTATYLLLRNDTRADVARQLDRKITEAAANPIRQSTRGFATTREVLDLRTAAVYELSSAGLAPAPILERGEPLDEQVRHRIDGYVPRLRTERTVRGIVGSLAYAARRSRSDESRVLVYTKTLPDNLGRLLRWFAVGGIVAFLVVVGAAAVVARRITRPLRAAEATTRRIAAGDLSVRVPVPSKGGGGRDEVGDLARSINTMAEELDRSRHLERQFLMSVSHDLRTPLTSIRGYAEAIAEGTANDHARAATVIASESRRLERLVRDLLELAKLNARQFTLDPRRTDVTELVTDGADGFLPAAQSHGLALALETDDGLFAVIDPERVAQALANLIENAMKFARSTVTVGAHARAVEIELTVTDDGPGIAAQDLPHIFERMYTSDRRPTRQIGSGLGLAIVHELVVAMGGTVRAVTGGDGTTITVTFAAA